MRHRRLLMALYFVAAVVLLLRAGLRERGVLLDHVEFGRRLLFGEDLYGTFEIPGRRNPGPLHTPYPPSFGLLTLPFALVPEMVARFAWAALSLVAVGGIGRAVAFHLGPATPRTAHRFHLLFIGAVLLASRYVLRDTHGGGGNLINLALAFCGATAALAGRQLPGGILLGLSLATKPTQVLLLGFLLLVGRGRAAAVALVTFAAVGLLSLVLLRLDPTCWWQWLEGSIAYGTRPDPYTLPQGGFPPFTWMNQCLQCGLFRYLGTVPVTFAAEINGFAQGLGWPHGIVRAVSVALAVALLVATYLQVWRHRHSAMGRARTLAALAVLSLLLSPITWKAHHVALLPAFCILLTGPRRWILVLFLLYLPTCVIGEEITGKDAKNWLQSTYLITAWDLVILALLLCRPSAPLEYGESAVTAQGAEVRG